MKRIILLALLVVAGTMIIWSQVPQAMNYKAIAKDDWGVALPSKTITLRFTILQGSGTGSIVYQEKHTTTTNKFGLMDVEIGKGSPCTVNTFDDIDWSTGVYYIQIEMDPKGGEDFRLEDPAHQLLSVPYALYAGSSGNTNFTETDPFFVSSPSSGIWSSDIFNWNTAFGWGNHANEGYLKSFTESDPLFLFHPAHGVTSENINNWNTTFGWGNHADAGYLKSFTELDPVFIAHPVSNITSENISNWNTAFSWGNHAGLYRHISYVPAWSEIIDKPSFSTVATSGSYNDLADKPTIDGSETIVLAGNNVTVTGEGTTTNPYSINSSGVGTTLTGNTPGDMQYWNGSAWVIVAAGNEGQVLTFTGGVPTWTTTSVAGDWGDVYNPLTGKTWMDRNLGASRVAISSTDGASYGDLYQWGRGTDGHEIRSSGTTTTLSTGDTPGHGTFIVAPESPYDWRSPQNDNLWQGVSGINNPCPTGYRLPTEAELDAERLSWGSNNAAGAIASPLKLPMAGFRSYSNGSFIYVGTYGLYWSSTLDGIYSRSLSFNSSNAAMGTAARPNGDSVRCLKD